MNFLSNLFTANLITPTQRTLTAEAVTRASLTAAIEIYCQTYRTGDIADLKIESVIRVLCERTCIEYVQAQDFSNSDLSEASVRFFLKFENEILEAVLNGAEPVATAQYICFGVKP
jgi:hypothetical protein